MLAATAIVAGIIAAMCSAPARAEAEGRAGRMTTETAEAVCAKCEREALECDDDGVYIYRENAAAHIGHRVSCTWGCGARTLTSAKKAEAAQ